MNIEELKALFDSGELTIDMDSEPGYYGENTVTALIKYKGTVIAKETHSTYCNCSPCGCGY